MKTENPWERADVLNALDAMASSLDPESYGRCVRAFADRLGVVPEALFDADAPGWRTGRVTAVDDSGEGQTATVQWTHDDHGSRESKHLTVESRRPTPAITLDDETRAALGRLWANGGLAASPSGLIIISSDEVRVSDLRRVHNALAAAAGLVGVSDG